MQVRFLCVALFGCGVLSAQELSESYLGRFQLGYQAHEEGRFEQAAVLLESCLELDLGNPTVAYALACVHARAGRRELALSWLGRAVDWGYADGAVMSWDADLAWLRSHTRFQALVARASAVPEAQGEPSQAVVRWLVPAPRDMCLSESGTRAVSEGRGEAWLWDTETWDLVAVLNDGAGFRECKLSPSGESFIVAWNDGGLHMGSWDVTTGKSQWELAIPPVRGLDYTWPRLRFSRDGMEIRLHKRGDISMSKWGFSLSKGGLANHWEDGGEPELAAPMGSRMTLERHPRAMSPVVCMAPVGESALALLTEDNTLRVVDVDRAQLLWARPTGLTGIANLYHLPGPGLLVLEGQERIGFLDLRSRELWSMPGDKCWPGPDGKRVAVRDGATLWMVDPVAREESVQIAVQSTTTCLAWSHASDRVALADSSHLRVFEVASGAQVMAFPGVEDHKPTSISFRADDRVLASGWDDHWMRLIDSDTGELVAEREVWGTHSLMPGVAEVLFTDDGRQLLVVSGFIPCVMALNPESLETNWTYDGYRGGPSWVRLQQVNSNRRLYCTTSYEGPQVLDLARGRVVMDGRPDLEGIAASPNEVSVFAVRDGAIEVLDGQSLELRYSLVEFPAGGELVFLPSLYCHGTLEALKNSWVVTDGQARSLESLAEVLYDPKRVLAAAAGVPVRPARIRE